MEETVSHVMTKSLLVRGTTVEKRTPCDCWYGRDHLEATDEELSSALRDLEKANLQQEQHVGEEPGGA